MSDTPRRQAALFESERFATRDSQPVTCLGQTFPNDAARRAHFTELLRQKLQDPDFRKIEGFPIGSDEDILALSDPPYYCACPNPWIADFLRLWEEEKSAECGVRSAGEGESATSRTPSHSAPRTAHYHREPFAADVSEGKNDPIYNAHSYHTKVPHKAIMRYILHYTEPGDIVFDGFCGTGMTGVAAQLCGDRRAVEALGYRVEADGTILREETDDNGKPAWRAFSRLGARRAVLNDLSPAATFIAYNYNTPVDVAAFEREARRILAEVERECGWMYETRHTNGGTGKINYTVWSDVFVCPDCAGEVVFWNSAVKKSDGSVLKEFPCTHCGALLTKQRLERTWTTRFDRALNETVKQAKQVPVIINYSVGKKRYEKTPDADDLALIDKIEGMEIPYWFPTTALPDGFNTRQPKGSHGITHVHHFYTMRNLWIMATCYAKANSIFKRIFKFGFLNTAWHATKMRRFNPRGGDRPLSGTLYVPSLPTEGNMIDVYSHKIKQLNTFIKLCGAYDNSFLLGTYSTNDSIPQDNFIDYIFLDPPFGSNINYSELDSLWESWLKVWTNNKTEAIVNDVQGKDLSDYRALMVSCFRKAFRVLKPGRWMTVEFSNTSASVWNSIQSALAEAGFVVANVAALDKQQGSFKAYTTPTAVKQDLVISAYKPNGGFEERFALEAESEAGVWDFVRTHLSYLPVVKMQGGRPARIPERDPRILFDQLVAFYVRKGRLVPLSSQEFQLGLHQRFAERDGMFFLPEQAAEYDKKRLTAGEPAQASLFVQDEASAIDWLRNALRDKPQTFQELHPQFIKELGGYSKHEKMLELSTLLEQNFLCFDGKDAIPAQIVSWMMKSSSLREMIVDELRVAGGELNSQLSTQNSELRRKAADRWYVPDPNRAGDLEKLREKALLREFEEYKASKKKLKVFRLEAVRAGFKKAWQDRDYAVIVAVAEKIPSAVLEEDPKLLMWYDQAVTRMGGE